MHTYLITINFDDEFGQNTVEESLSDHPQILSFLTTRQGVQLAPNSFILKTSESTKQLMAEITPFIDRSENVFIFKVDISDWNAIAPQEILDGIQKLADTEATMV